ncbi:uncharacterized protein [Lepeophtheirus salmonis]|uniref:uncharacterized protein n=1 Tax=Lepeophtheirus salmonis TaxID=72036 RepID=UPI001AE3B820|nr:uncharacterized protein LOC121123902 [Lepeophtheirus salmonis]
MSKILNGLLNRKGCKVETKISSNVLSQAQHIAIGKTNILGEDLPRVKELIYGEEHKIKLQSQTAVFFRINITRKDLDHGVIIRCKSTYSDKFKVIFFDANGDISMCKESEYSTNGSEGNFLFFPFRHYNLKMEHNYMNTEKDMPKAFSLLEFFDLNYESIEPGNHLFCVYQNNWINSGNCILSCLKVQPCHGNIIEEIKDLEEDIQGKKTELDQLKVEYKEVKEKYENILNKVHTLTPAVNERISTRLDLYHQLFSECKETPIGGVISEYDSRGVFKNIFSTFKGS